MKYADSPTKRDYIKKLIVSIYIGERGKALVNGQIPVVARGQNVSDVLSNRDSWVAK